MVAEQGHAAPPAAATPPVITAGSPDKNYVLGPADVIEVSVLTHAEYTTRGRIGEDGEIRLPYIGAINAARKTSNELADEISAALIKGGYYERAIVRVEIVSFASRYVTVLGDVGSPGIVPVDRAYRVSEILARVGGVRETAADYLVLRPQNGPERKLLVKDVATGDELQDPYVSPGDKIYAPKAEMFYVSGMVAAPGAFPLTADMTIRMAIARAGGVTLQGTDKNIRLTRHGARVPHVDLNSKVEGGDVLVVPENLFAF
jgi:polysaccharide export outer membrane protein